MNAKLGRQLRFIATLIAGSIVAGIIYAVARGAPTAIDILIAVTYAVEISGALIAIEMTLEAGAAGRWVSGLPFSVGILLRSLVYGAVILGFQYFDTASLITGKPTAPEHRDIWQATLFSGAVAVTMNIAVAIANLIGPRALLNFISGRYHTPSEENRFVLFVDIAGSTGLAEKLGGIGIHRFLDRTFRLLTETVLDYRGEVLGYVGDELIVTWPEKAGAIDARPLRCFLAMREALVQAASRFEREFGAVPRIRGSLNFGSVIVGEIGEVKRAIVFNGDVMNTAARLEEQSRHVDGGFVAARAAIARFDDAPPVALRDLGPLTIRGRVDPVDAMALVEVAAISENRAAAPAS